MDIVHPGQFIAFAKDLETGAVCDASGRPFPEVAAATCTVFDSLAEARAFCGAAVLAAPGTRFDVFDAEGRARPPLLTIVHPEKTRALEDNPRDIQRRRAIAWALIAGGVPLVATTYWTGTSLAMMVPVFVGVNMIIAGGRLLWLNLAMRETERERHERLDRLER
jgi:hypothetical protein